MPGQNLFHQLYESRETKAASVATCVFISHKKEDKDAAKEIANILKEMNVDIYFDEDDKVLRQATDQRDDQAIVNCIEAGLNSCTHLLGIITPLTKESWWVPYEIGSATARGRTCAHLITKDVPNLPSYVAIATVLKDVDSVKSWIPTKRVEPTRLLNEIFAKEAAAKKMLKYLPQSRPPIQFYKAEIVRS